MSNSIKNYEKKLETAVEKTEEKIEQAEKSILKNKWFKPALTVIGIIAIAGGLLYWQYASTRVKIDAAQIQAESIQLSPTAAGQLEETYVHEGDTVTANQALAKVGAEIIKSKIAGQIISVPTEIGKTYAAGQTVITMIDPTELRVVGQIDENKGLDKIRVGQLASFTADAFGSKKYYGIVDEISSTSHQSDVVFNVSDQRQIQQFDIKVRFNRDAYTELKNGMSARITIFTK